MDWFESANEYLAAWKARDATWRDKFNLGALQALRLGRAEAERLNRNYIGTEHLFLGLTKLGPASPHNLFRKLGVNFELIGAEIEKLAGFGTFLNEPLRIPYTPRLNKVINSAKEDAKALSNSRVGPGHLLSGLLKESEGVIAATFKNLGMDRDQLRNRVLEEMRSTKAFSTESKIE